MADIDPELVERAIRWCAEAGRQTTPAQVLAALAPLKWDELLAARALLADPPPARPLGPFALADISRGAPSDVAAERERSGRYGTAMADAAPTASAPPPRPKASKRLPARAPFVVRRAAHRGPALEPAPRALALVDELLLEEGRAVLGRLLRRHGGKRARILEALAAGWRRPDGLPLAPPDLDRVLAHHGMARAFETRERDEILHTLRAAGGVRARAAAALGLDRAALDEALERLGARADAERFRGQRRRELRARGTLTERTHLVLDEGERLADLDLLEEFVGDLRARLPDHLRALGATGAEPLGDKLCRSLTLDARGVERLAQVTGLKLEAAGGRAPAPGRPDGRRPPRRPGSDRPQTARATPGRGNPQAGAPRTGAPRKGAPRTGAPRSGPPRTGAPRKGAPRAGAAGRRPPPRPPSGR